MWPSRTTTVTVDFKVIELQIDPDARLAAAAGGAARYLAEAAGLTSEEAAELQKSIIAACLESFENSTGDHARLTVTLMRYPDRIEIAIAHEGDAAPAVGLDRIAGFATQVAGSGGLGGVDRVQYETRGGLAITRLTKYLGHLPPIQ
jgi:hypothetical protein